MPAGASIQEIMYTVGVHYRLQQLNKLVEAWGLHHKGTQQQHCQQQEAAVEQADTADAEHGSIDLLSEDKCSEPGQQDAEEGLTIILNKA